MGTVCAGCGGKARRLSLEFSGSIAQPAAVRRSSKWGIAACRMTRSSVLFLCVATNDIACDTSYLVTACSGQPGTRFRYWIGFSVAAPAANGSLISMSLPTLQMHLQSQATLDNPPRRFVSSSSAAPTAPPGSAALASPALTSTNLSEPQRLAYTTS